MAKKKTKKRRPSLKKLATKVSATKSARPQQTRSVADSPTSASLSASRAKEKILPIVGVGASAGGLEAFTQLLEHLPPNPGMAFVLIQHLDRTHDSQLTEILARKSPLPMQEVGGETLLEADHVYVISATENLRIEHGVLRTVPRIDEPGVRNMPIDDFLQSLAKDRGNRAFGVVLSGTASDGTLGLKAIKAEGGITFAQEPSSAKFDGMPRSAIAAGAVDFVLTPEAIAKQLVALGDHSYLRDAPVRESARVPSSDGDLNRIFQQLRTATGIDFTYYKPNTIMRRIQRRMALHGLDNLKDYARRLRQDSGEAKILAQDFLINVTAFFREPETYQKLKEVVFPALLKNRLHDDRIRIWIPGCSTGEEAYSYAISLTEFLEDRDQHPPIQIFATDLSDAVIEKARSGVYLEGSLAGVSAERIKRFFVKRERVYQISKAIRDICVFAKQDLAKDPPFSKLDLISCCNLLIYLGPALQKKALSLFQYALKPGGFLILGSSESIGALAASFQTIDRKSRIYAKKAHSVGPEPYISLSYPSSGQSSQQEHPGENGTPLKSIQKQADRLLLAEYAPVGVIVDETMHVVQVRGDTGPYLQLPSGEPTTDLSRLVRPGLLGPLRAAIRKARQQNASVREAEIRVKAADQFRDVVLRVSPLRDSHSAEQCFLILFEDATRQPVRPQSRKKRGKPGVRHKRDEEVSQLEQELTATRDYLQSIIESQEAATEELRSANEEAQATNEELDTAKEELQATNEELNTVNDELRARNIEQSTLNSDLRKLLESINVPLVMVGRDLHIRWFTPAIEPLLNLLPTDQGRPITDLHSEAIPNFRELLLHALAGEKNTNVEIEGHSGRWLSLRILPYRGPDNTIDGAIATLIDIDDLKRARDFAEIVTATVREPLVVLDAALRIRTANDAFYRFFRMNKQDTEGRLIYEIGRGQWNIPRLKQLLEEILPKEIGIREFEVQQNYEGIGLKTILLHAREIRQGDGERMIVLAIDDVTELRQSAENLRRSNEDLKQFIYAASHDLQEPLRMVVTYAQMLAAKYAGELNGEGAKYIQYAVDGALRLESLVSGLLEFWQLSEQVEEHPVPVNCNEILKTVLLNLEAPIRENNAQITSGRLPSLMASTAPLTQLFQNLIANALKYRSADPPRIHVSAVKENSEWIFSIADNGMGIDPQYTTEIFRVFRRLHSREKYPGTGMGLAICQRIVERYGGRIWVESEPGRGSTFRFALPL
jgi:two-component system, chemotaxis family, CheB/CheR fusion protein